MKQSAGILLFRRIDHTLEVFLVHPGGPFWTSKDDGAWSIPKGEYQRGEDPLAAAQRELTEETGINVEGPVIDLGSVTQGRSKTVSAWATERDFDPSRLRSNQFEMEWPPRSGKHPEFPEVDRGAWFTLEEAATKLIPEQRRFLERLALRLPGRR